MIPAERQAATVVLAERVMGWKVHTSGRGSTVAFNADYEDEQILATTHPWECVTWDPWAQDHDSSELAEAVINKGHSLYLYGCRGSWIARFEGFAQVEHKDRRQAIALAALKVVEHA